MNIMKEIVKGQIIPKWYGVAWVRYERHSAICYPIPINLIVRLFREIGIFIKYGYITKGMCERDAYEEGYAKAKLEKKELWEYDD